MERHSFRTNYADTVPFHTRKLDEITVSSAVEVIGFDVKYDKVTNELILKQNDEILKSWILESQLLKKLVDTNEGWGDSKWDSGSGCSKPYFLVKLL